MMVLEREPEKRKEHGEVRHRGMMPSTARRTRPVALERSKARKDGLCEPCASFLGCTG